MKKQSLEELSVFGAEPAFEKKIPVGQLNFPDWDKVEESFRAIFLRRYYTNQGPLTQELESRLEELLGVKHVISMVNATIALMISAKALDLKGKVICPAFTFPATAQSLTWAGLEPVFCDVDPETHQMSVDSARVLIDDEVSAILGVHLWGNPCHPYELEALAAEHDLKIYFDAAHGFGCKLANTFFGNFGDLEIFSFHATKVLNAMEGGCVCTNDDDIAARVRNIRSSYGAGHAVEIPLTGNGRMSEAQAAMALLSLEDFSQNVKRNKECFDLYKEMLASIPGIKIIEPGKNITSNYQYMVIEVAEKGFGISRDKLFNILNKENIGCRRYFTPGLHKAIPYLTETPQYANSLPVTDYLCEHILQLPLGELVDEESVRDICEIIKLIHNNSVKLQ